jgi:uncharacterized protein YunC (DUF1805 family)
MAKTDPINTSVPADTGEAASLGASRIRALARAVIELLQKDHYTGASSPYNEDAAGEHAKVTLRETTKPTNVADKGFLYTKDVSGTTELFYEDAAGNEKQLTTAGKLNVAATEAVLLTGAQTVAGVKTFSDAPVVPTQTAGDNTTKAASTAFVAAGLALKSGLMSPTAVDGSTVSVTLPNGLIVKWGTGSGEASYTFTVAFPSGCYKVFLTPLDASGTNNFVSAKSASGFSVEGGVGLYDWFAIGY